MVRTIHTDMIHKVRSNKDIHHRVVTHEPISWHINICHDTCLTSVLPNNTINCDCASQQDPNKTNFLAAFKVHDDIMAYQ